MLNVTKTQTLRTQQPHGQEQEQQRETTRNNAKQRETTIHRDRLYTHPIRQIWWMFPFPYLDIWWSNFDVEAI